MKKSCIYSGDISKIIKDYKLKSGDLILCEGVYISDEIISIFQGSKYTHVMTVYRHPENNMFYFLESTVQYSVDKWKDYHSGKYKNGPMMIKLDKRYSTYQGKLYLRRLNKPLNDDQINSMYIFSKLHNHFDFESNMLEMANAQLKIKFSNSKSFHTGIFCSEYVAELYQTLGLINGPECGGLSSKYYTPKDFAVVLEKLNNGYEFEDVIQLKPPIKL